MKIGEDPGVGVAKLYKQKPDRGGVATVGLRPRWGRRGGVCWFGSQAWSLKLNHRIESPRVEEKAEPADLEAGLGQSRGGAYDEAGLWGPITRMPRKDPGISAGGAAFRGDAGLERLEARHLAGILGSSVLGGVGLGAVPEELASELARKAKGSMEADFRLYPSPAAPGAGVEGAHWIRGVTAERAWEFKGLGVGPGQGRPYGSQ